MATLTQEQFLERCFKVHGDRYDYSITKYRTAHQDVEIICKTHGVFRQMAYVHLNGCGCPACGREATTSAGKSDMNKVLTKLKEKFGDGFDFSGVLQVANTAEKFGVKCPEHGWHSFTVNRLLHAKAKYACPKCGMLAGNKGKNLKTTKWFISKAESVHGNLYDYSKSKYVDTFTPVIIICSEHGEFLQEPRVHLSGHGCQKCGVKKITDGNRLDKEEFVSRAIAIHGDKFSYERTKFKGMNSRIAVECKIHGEFETTATYHLSDIGKSHGGCRECSKASASNTISFAEFVDRARSLYGDVYSYSEYTKMTDYVTVMCPTHGRVKQLAYVHLKGGGCPICSKSKSVSSEEASLLEALIPYISLTAGDRKLIAPLELDMVSHDHKLAIEYCGLYWHSEGKGVGKYYHLAKQNAAEEAGYRLFTIFSDEWLNKPEIVKRLILSAAGIYQPTKIGARECEIKIADYSKVKDFYESNHLQGASAGYHLILEYNGKLVAAATFGKRAIYGKTPQLELIRFCNSNEVRAVGGLRRLCVNALRNLGEASLISYVDKRWFTGKSYLSNGFELEKVSEPGYWYVKGNTRASRYAYAKHTLKDKLAVFDPSQTEVENMKNNGWSRLFDCGQMKFRFEL